MSHLKRSNVSLEGEEYGGAARRICVGDADVATNVGARNYSY